MDLFRYIPVALWLAKHQAEIEQLNKLLGPTFAEFNKVKGEVLAILRKVDWST